MLVDSSRNDNYIAGFKKNVLFGPFALHVLTVVEVVSFRAANDHNLPGIRKIQEAARDTEGIKNAEFCTQLVLPRLANFPSDFNCLGNAGIGLRQASYRQAKSQKEKCSTPQHRIRSSLPRHYMKLASGRSWLWLSGKEPRITTNFR